MPTFGESKKNRRDLRTRTKKAFAAIETESYVKRKTKLGHASMEDYVSKYQDGIA